MNFTFENIKSISHDIASLDDNISRIDASILAQQDQQAEALKKDGDNKLFFDDVQVAIDSYFKEVLSLNGATYTRYLEQTLIDGAKKTQGNLHFPEGWASFSPKLIDSINGLPLSSSSGSEVSIIDQPINNISLLMNGFSDGNTESTLHSAYSNGPIVVDGGSWTIGQRVIVLGNPSLLATITAIGVFSETEGGVGGVGGVTTNYPSLTISKIAYNSGTIPEGAIIRNYFSGFSELERTTGNTQANDVFNGTTSEIKSRLLDVDYRWDEQFDAITANTIKGADRDKNTIAKNNLQECSAMYSAWLSLPEVSPIGRYCDIELEKVITKLNDRKAFTQTRPQEIISALGVANQDSSGVSSGNGLFYSLMKWVDLRANVGSGSLSTYYSLDLNFKFFSNEKSSLISKTNEQSNYFDVRKILSINGSVLVIDSSIGMSVGDVFGALDDVSTSILNVEILVITGNELIVNHVLDALSVGAYARLVKEK